MQCLTLDVGKFPFWLERVVVVVVDDFGAFFCFPPLLMTMMKYTHEYECLRL